MKIYLAVITNISRFGDNVDIIGVFSTPEKAKVALGDLSRTRQIGNFLWQYDHDGELITHFKIVEMELDQL